MTPVATVPDADIVAAARGDSRALDHVLQIVRPIIVRYCRARVGTAGPGQLCADDVAQEVCLAVMAALPRYADCGMPFVAFVYGIASHKIADASRQARQIRADTVSEAVCTAGDREQHALDVDARGRVDGLLATLPGKHREILILRLVVGMSAEETALAVGSTAAAVRVAQHRALGKLEMQVAKG